MKHLRPIIQWLQAHPVLIALLAYGLLEIWYAVRRGLRVAGTPQDIYCTVSVLLFLLITTTLGFVIFGWRLPSERRRVALNLALLVISAIPALIVFAFGYALIIRRQEYLTGHTMWGIVQADPDLIISLRPNLHDYRVYFAEQDRFIPISTDERGFRNTEDVSHAPIAGFGDSVLFGMWTPDEELWSVHLSNELGVPVANYGVYGYGLWQYNLMAERYGGAHDLVIYGIFTNDVTSVDITSNPLPPNFMRWQLWYWRSPISYTFRQFFVDESPGYRILQLVQSRRLFGLPGTDSASPPAEEPGTGGTAGGLPDGLAAHCWVDAADYAVGDNTALAGQLDRALALADGEGYRLLVVTIPSKEMVYADVLLPYCSEEARESVDAIRAGYAFICDHVQRRGGLCYDMTFDMQAAAVTEDLLYFPIDGHWNASGHRVFARLLAEFIRQNELLPDG